MLMRLWGTSTCANGIIVLSNSKYTFASAGTSNINSTKPKTMKYLQFDAAPLQFFIHDGNAAANKWVKLIPYYLWQSKLYKQVDPGNNHSFMGVRCMMTPTTEDLYDEPPYDVIVIPKDTSQYVGYYPVDLCAGWFRKTGDGPLCYFDMGVEEWIDVVEQSIEYKRNYQPPDDFHIDLGVVLGAKKAQTFVKKPDPPKALPIPNPDKNPRLQVLIDSGRVAMTDPATYVAVTKGIHTGKLFKMVGSGRRGWIKCALIWDPSFDMPENKKKMGDPSWPPVISRSNNYDLAMENCVILQQ